MHFIYKLDICMKYRINILCAVTVIIVFVAVGAQSQPGEWSEPLNISNTPYSSTYPDMEIGANEFIHVVWEDNIDQYNIFRKEIMYSYFNGNIWSEPVQLSGYDTTYSFSPRIALDSNGYPHVVWNHRAIFPDASIYYSTLTDSGWAEPYDLTQGLSTAYNPDVVIDSQDNIHVVWQNYHNGIFKIFHKIYNGNEWLPYTLICDDENSYGVPRIAVDSNDNLHLSCISLADIFYFKYNGLYWNPRENISNIDSLSSSNHCIAVDTYNNPHIVWRQELSNQMGEDIFYSHYTDIDWTIPENITNINSICYNPVLAINDQNVKSILFTVDEEEGDPYVYYIFCSENIWTTPDTTISHPSTYSTIALEDNDIIHACMPIGFIYYADIGYTNYQINTEVQLQVKFSNPEILSIQVYPNPFNQYAVFKYKLHRKSYVEIEIYNTIGEIVKQFNRGYQEEGQHSEFWSGTDNSGVEVISGIYFLRLIANDNSITKKIVIIR